MTGHVGRGGPGSQPSFWAERPHLGGKREVLACGGGGGRGGNENPTARPRPERPILAALVPPLSSFALSRTWVPAAAMRGLSARARQHLGRPGTHSTSTPGGCMRVAAPRPHPATLGPGPPSGGSSGWSRVRHQWGLEQGGGAGEGSPEPLSDPAGHLGLLRSAERGTKQRRPQAHALMASCEAGSEGQRNPPARAPRGFLARMQTQVLGAPEGLEPRPSHVPSPGQ